MTTIIGLVEPYTPGTSFTAYIDRLEQFFLVNKIKEDDKTPYFITMMGASIYETLMSLTLPELPSKKKYAELIKILKNYVEPSRNKRAERYRFHKLRQEQGESISDYILRLKVASQNCQFGDFLGIEAEAKVINEALDDALIDKFIVGLRDENIQRIFLKEDPKSFEKCCGIALNYEMSQKESKSLQPLSTNSIGNEKNKNWNIQRSQSHQSQSSNKRTNKLASSQNSFRKFTSNNQSSKQCQRCARYHEESSCPARNWKCFNCNRMGHTSTCCQFNNKSNSQNNLKTINSVNNTNEPALVEVQVEGTNLEMEVDTGACVSIISKGEYLSKFHKIKLVDFSNSLKTVSGQSLEAIGKIQLRVSLRSTVHLLELIVISSEQNFKPLLGRTWLDVLVPEWRNIWKINSIMQVRNLQNNFIEEIKTRFPRVFSNLPDSKIEGFTAEINMENDTVPIFHAPYSVPYKLREKVEIELDRLVKEQIIVPVKTSKWASPVVVVPKPNGDIRLCLDCSKTINKSVVTDHYPLPKKEDIFASLSGFSNCFCVIDLKGAYQQLSVSEMSKQFLTMNTLKGLFQYTKLPFGVTSAPSIFQSVMDQILLGIKGVFCYLDDILIGGTSPENCKSQLFVVLKRLNEHNVQINLDKCKFLESSVDYLGHTFSSKGISPNKLKVKAIVEAPVPENISQLQSYLGLIIYYGHFIPNLSMEIKALYNLLKKEVSFKWSSECQQAFEKSKKLMIQNTLLEYFDPEKPIVLATDASP